MGDYKFFDIDGKTITKEKFIDFYNKCYFRDTAEKVPYVNKSSCFVEQEIETILKSGIKSKKDVIKILAWKIGKIKHSESQSKIMYAKDWEGAEKSFTVSRFRRPMELGGFAEYITENYDELHNLSADRPQQVLDKLKDKAPDGIGTVYLLTLLYFISEQKYPIYDRFACIAINAIRNGSNPVLSQNEKIDVISMPDKKGNFKDVYEIYKKNYLTALQDIFKEKYNKRDVDRALWVYGHRFNKKGNC